ncbi:MAG: hypothetical protein E7Z90_05500 [Cyanobacteria bacterium SIG29]|nr:hypothetical protein [Cyanobacteria bacterium SIG29]
MSKYKNAILIIISFIMLLYSGFVLITPVILNKTFDIDKFEEKVYKSTSLITTLDYIDFKIKPNFNVEIVVRNLSMKYIDYQPMFDAGRIHIVASPSIIFGNKYDIKSLSMKNVWYADQILPDGKNKIAFLPSAFDTNVFGKKSITVSPSDIDIKHLKVTYVTPKTYKEQNFRTKEFTEQEVYEFLNSLTFSHVKIKN